MASSIGWDILTGMWRCSFRCLLQKKKTLSKPNIVNTGIFPILRKSVHLSTPQAPSVLLSFSHRAKLQGLFIEGVLVSSKIKPYLCSDLGTIFPKWQDIGRCLKCPSDGDFFLQNLKKIPWDLLYTHSLNPGPGGKVNGDSDFHSYTLILCSFVSFRTAPIGGDLNSKQC